MNKIIAAAGVLVALAVPAAAAELSPRIDSQIVSPNYDGNTAATDGFTTGSVGYDLRNVDVRTGDDASQRVGQSDIFGAQSR